MALLVGQPSGCVLPGDTAAALLGSSSGQVVLDAVGVEREIRCYAVDVFWSGDV